MIGWGRIVLAVSASLVSVCGASAPTARLLTANFSGGCRSYTIRVAGEGLDQPNPVVSYNLTLAPRSGSEPMILTDSFEVIPDKDGSFRKSIRSSWRKFGFEASGNYTLSGSAILISKQTPLHTLPLAFSKATLDCSPKPSNR